MYENFLPTLWTSCLRCRESIYVEDGRHKQDICLIAIKTVLSGPMVILSMRETFCASF